MTAAKFFSIPDGSMLDFQQTINNWFTKNPESRYIDMIKFDESTAVLFYEGSPE